VTWLDGGRAIDAHDVGERAVTLSRMRTAGLPALRGFALGRSLFERATEVLHGDGSALMHLPQDVGDPVVRALRQLGGPVAVRRSDLPDVPPFRDAQTEAYLHVMHPTDVLEAIRRLWSGAVGAARPISVVVQKFVVADVSCRVREARGTLEIESCYGVGDLLAQGLVVPDRHKLARDGAILERHVGRKAQMTIPRTDGGVVRVPVPVASSREYALDDEQLAHLAGLWRDAERALGQLARLSVSVAGAQVSITSAERHTEASQDLVLG
jgi:pyruvate,water dikinase